MGDAAQRGTTGVKPGMNRRQFRAWQAIVAWLLGTIVLAGFVLLVSPPARLAVRSAILVPSFFAALPGDPIDWFSARPLHEVVELQDVHGFVRAHVYRPPAGRHPALVISLGLNPAPPDDPRVTRLMDGLARAGLIAVLVQSEAMDNDRLFPDLPTALVEGVEFTMHEEYVRADRVGLFGFSVGGSLALVAAADPSLANRLRLVESFGGYARLDDALLSVATHTLDDDGAVRTWEPLDDAQRHLASALIAGLRDDTEADLLRRRYVAGEAVEIDPSLLSSEGGAIANLLSVRDRASGRRLLALLPPLTREDIVALSPLPVVSRLHTKLFVMYDSHDPLLPYTGSQEICRAARMAGLQPYCSQFSIFQHVDPTRGGNPLVVSHDFVELYLHAFAILRRLQ